MISNLIKVLEVLSLCTILSSCANHSVKDKKEEDTIINALSYNKKDTYSLFLGTVDNDSIFVKGKFITEEDDTLYENPTIIKGGKVIYKDTTHNQFIINSKKCFIKTVNKANYIFLDMLDAPFVNKWNIIGIVNDHVIVYKNILQDIFKDINNDGFYEVGGVIPIDAVCLDCDSFIYTPYLVYSLKDRLVFDSILSMKLTKQTYGVFLGFNVLDTVIVIKRTNNAQ